MKHILAILLLQISIGMSFAACRHTCELTHGEDTSKVDSTVWYVYDVPGSDSEDNILELSFKNGSVVGGYFWGTSDEFCEGREGYYPGFFVLRLSQIHHDGGNLSFVLNSKGMSYCSGPVDASVHSTEEAQRRGSHEWMQDARFFTDSIRYCGTFREDGFLLSKEKSKYPYLEDHYFTIYTREALRKLKRECPYEKENRK